MKKLILLILLLPTIVFAGNVQRYYPLAFLNRASGSTEDVCSTSGLLTSWHMENADLDNEDGCSVVGDSVWTLMYGAEVTSDDKSDGTYSLSDPTDGYACQLDPTQNTTTGEFKVEFDTYIGTYVANSEFFKMYTAGSDFLIIRMYNGDSPNIDLQTISSNETGTWYFSCDTNLSSSTWYRITYQFDPSATYKQQLTIQALDDSSPRQLTGSPSVYTDTTQNLGVFDNVVDTVYMNGNTGMYLDRFYYYTESGL